MPLNLGVLLKASGIDPRDVQVIRHAFVKVHEETGVRGIHADSTDDEILAYTAEQSASTRVFPAEPPRFWIVFIREGGDRARFWSVVENRAELPGGNQLRYFDLAPTDQLSELKNRLVIGWRSPRAWRLTGSTAATYPVLEIADAQPVAFPGFDQLVLGYDQLQVVMREYRYETWRTALSAVMGIYLITDTRDGRQYVGKADGSENLKQRWAAYASNGHGGNVELRGLNPQSFRFSLLRVFDPAVPPREINGAENHFKRALDTRRHGLNRN